MEISITIDSVDKTSSVLSDTLRISDRINQQINEATFSTKHGYRPNVGDEVSITDGTEVIFAGVIVKIKQTNAGLRVNYDVTCKDWTHYLDRKLVIERYEDTNVEDIIDDIITTYAPTFTTTNVSAPTPVRSIAFNRITISEAIEKLAERIGYSWYVDYNQDVHFFPKNEELAPFNITASGGNHVWGSLEMTEDISQLRNRIYVVGGEAEGNSRTEEYVADGDQLQFPLANKFASLPTVVVNSVSQTVGVDFIDAEDDYDCFWNYEQKYIRFKTGTKPTATYLVEVSGIPLYPIVVNLPSPVSIAEYGEYQFKIVDNTIKTRDEAVARARVELQDYADSIEEGSFTTYTSGLTSGQTISIDANGISAEFVIQNVTLTMRTEEDGEWRVKVATKKTLGIIEFLQSLLRDGEIRQDEAETLINLQSLAETGYGSDILTLPADTTSPEYLYE